VGRYIAKVKRVRVRMRVRVRVRDRESERARERSEQTKRECNRTSWSDGAGRVDEGEGAGRVETRQHQLRCHTAVIEHPNPLQSTGTDGHGSEVEARRVQAQLRSHECCVHLQR
jgi:hypothetical protein